MIWESSENREARQKVFNFFVENPPLEKFLDPRLPRASTVYHLLLDYAFNTATQIWMQDSLMLLSEVSSNLKKTARIRTKP